MKENLPDTCFQCHVNDIEILRAFAWIAIGAICIACFAPSVRSRVLHSNSKASATHNSDKGKQQTITHLTVRGISWAILSNGKIYISSKSNDDKQITIFDVLGKKVFQTLLTSKELNVATLSPGVYFIKIEEGDSSATRKLIIR